jgi:hypothetical protein
MLRHACGYKLADDGHDTRAIQSRASQYSEYDTVHRLGAAAVFETEAARATTNNRRARVPPFDTICGRQGIWLPDSEVLPTAKYR